MAVKESRGRTNYELRCFTKNGQPRVVHAGDPVKNTVHEILERAQAKGVNVVLEWP